VAYAFDDTQHGADLFDLKVPGVTYSRIMNPTNGALEARMTALEGGIAHWWCFGHDGHYRCHPDHCRSGRQHCRVVGALRWHLQTHGLLLFRQQGIEVRFLYLKHPVSFGAADHARTKAVFCESIGNCHNVTDIAALAEGVRRCATDGGIAPTAQVPSVPPVRQ
jgi:O-acetylhomoserine (thiol)-lyase